MATKAGFKHTVPGAKGERRSPRIYTHGIVARHDYAQALASYTARYVESHAENFQYHLTSSQRKLGEPQYPGNEVLREHIVDQEYLDEHKAALAKLGGTLEAAREQGAQQARDQVAGLRKRNGDGLVVVAWSMSAGNASKAAQKFATTAWYNLKDVQVMEAVRS